MRFIAVAAFAAVTALSQFPAAYAETTELRIVKQYGLPYVPIMLLESEKLIEKEVAAAGLPPVNLTLVTVNGASQAADVLLSGTADIISVGTPTLATLWAKTKDSNNPIRGTSALQSQPFYLVTRDANVKTIKDFTENDRIAVPAVKITAQALVLEIAAAQVFGESSFDKLDPLTVQMTHPDAATALLSGKGQVTAHFGVAPYYWDELADPKLHSVLFSYDVMGGRHTNGVWVATTKFKNDNPKLYAAVLKAQDDANAMIKNDPKKVAEIYLRMAEDRKHSVEEMTKMVADPDFDYTQTPVKTQAFAEFMFRVGRLTAKPASWKDMFFENVHALPGS